MYRVTVFDSTDTKHLHMASAIRRQVFIVEQGIDATLEWDGRDAEATHFLLLDNKNAIGTARHRCTPEGIKLERFAILPAYRNKGTGAILLAAVMDALPKEGVKIYLHAQEKAVNYYLRAGFRIQGKHFFEAGIKHYLMVKENGLY